jgi:hypothetical protein
MKPRAVGLETARSMRVSCGVRPTGRASDCMICHNLMAIGINAEAAWRHFDAPINEREHGEETAKRLPVNAIVSATSAKPERGERAENAFQTRSGSSASAKRAAPSVAKRMFGDGLTL